MSSKLEHRPPPPACAARTRFTTTISTCVRSARENELTILALPTGPCLFISLLIPAAAGSHVTLLRPSDTGSRHLAGLETVRNQPNFHVALTCEGFGAPISPLASVKSAIEHARGGPLNQNIPQAQKAMAPSQPRVLLTVASQDRPWLRNDSPGAAGM